MLKAEIIHRKTNARIIKNFVDFKVTRTGVGLGGAGTWPRYWLGFDLAFFGEGIVWEKVENSHFCHHTSLSTDSWSELQPQDSWALTGWTLVSTAWKWRWKEFSCVPLLGTPWTVAHQAPLSMRFPQARVVGCHFLLQGVFLTQGLNPGLPHCRQILYCLSLYCLPTPNLPWTLSKGKGVSTWRDFYKPPEIMDKQSSPGSFACFLKVIDPVKKEKLLSAKTIKRKSS